MIELNQVIYRYDLETMRFNFTAKQGEVITILGPSGAGKSTLLSLIAGFIAPNSGKILLNHKDETNTAPSKRPVSMLFQDNNLFTHLSVEQNLALGLSPSLKLTPAKQQQLTLIAQRIGLEGHLSSYPTQLSGVRRRSLG